MSLSAKLISHKQVNESLKSIGLGIQLEDEHIRNRIHDSKVLRCSGSHFGHTKNNGVIGIGFVNGDYLVQVKFLT